MAIYRSCGSIWPIVVTFVVLKVCLSRAIIDRFHQDEEFEVTYYIVNLKPYNKVTLKITSTCWINDLPVIWEIILDLSVWHLYFLLFTELLIDLCIWHLESANYRSDLCYSFDSHRMAHPNYCHSVLLPERKNLSYS